MNLSVTTTAALPDDYLLVVAAAAVAPYSGALGAPALYDQDSLLAAPYPTATLSDPKVLIPPGQYLSQYPLFSVDIAIPAASTWTWAAGSPPAGGVAAVLNLPGFVAGLVPGATTTVYFSRSITPADYATFVTGGLAVWTPLPLP